MPDLDLSVDEEALEMLTAVAQAARAERIEWMIAGATARILLFEEGCGLPPSRATSDTDLGVKVESWESYRALQERLTRDQRFTPDARQRQRVRFRERSALDLVPFGEIASPEDTLRWPPDGDVTMCIAGFQEALDGSIRVRLNGKLRVRLVSPEGLILLKLFAWRDRHLRHPRKDASDLAYVLKHGVEIVTKGAEDALYQEHARDMEAADFDDELASSRVLGRRLSRIAGAGTLAHFVALLDEELDEGEDSRLAREVAEALRHIDAASSPELRAYQLLTHLRAGCGG